MFNAFLLSHKYLKCGNQSFRSNEVVFSSFEYVFTGHRNVEELGLQRNSLQKVLLLHKKTVESPSKRTLFGVDGLGDGWDLIALRMKDIVFRVWAVSLTARLVTIAPSVDKWPVALLRPSEAVER
jgi:hypothetical protein